MTIVESRQVGDTLYVLVEDKGRNAVPILGDAFDFLYRSNTKNLRIIKKHLDKHHPQTVVIEG